MMEKAYGKAIGVALVVALVFCSVPFPTGNRLLDSRIEEAEAIAPVVVPAIVFATAAAAYGVYVAGSEVSEYIANRDALYSEFVSGSGMTRAEADEMMAGAVTLNGNVDMGALARAGFFGLLPSLAAGLVESGTAATGVSSAIAGSGKLVVNGHAFETVSGFALDPGLVEYAKKEYGYDEDGFIACREYDASYSHNGTQYNVHVTQVLFVSRYAEINCYENETEYYLSNSASSRDVFLLHIISRKDGKALDEYDKDWYTANNTGLSTISRHYLDGTPYSDYTGRINADNAKIKAMVAAGTGSIVGDVAGKIASVIEEAKAGTMDVPEGVYEAFSPTDAQLAAGYTYQDVLAAKVDANSELIATVQEKVSEQAREIAAANAGVSALSSRVSALESSVGELGDGIGGVNGQLGEIIGTLAPWAAPVTGILALLSPIGLIYGIVQTIATAVAAIHGAVTGVQSSPFDWLASWWDALTGWWSTLLAWLADSPLATWWDALSAWLGATPASQLVNGLDATLGGIDGSIGGVLGALQGWWQGVLDWLGDTPIAELIRAVNAAIAQGVTDLAADLAGVISAVQEAVGAITGAIDGISAGEGALQPFGLVPGSGDFAVDSGKVRTFETTLNEKAPWAYVVALDAAFQAASGTYSARQSFYFDLDVPYAGNISFDASPWLLYSFNGFTVAYLIRVAVTAFICIMLLRVVYKTMERVMSFD